MTATHKESDSREPDFSPYPLAALAAAFAAGVLLTRLTSLTLAPCVALAALAAVAALLAAFKNMNTAAARLVVLAFTCAGASLSSIEARASRDGTRLRSFYERGLIGPAEPLEVTGVLERTPELAPDGLLLALRVERVRRGSVESPCAGRVELFARVGEHH